MHLNSSKFVAGNQTGLLSNRIHLNMLQAYVDAVVGGSRETLAAFVARFCEGSEETERRRIVVALKDALTGMTLQTCEKYGMSTRKFATFRRLRG
ncbi:MAG: hypothetical protein JO110_05780 [Acetobacteraceae bacterium]|nr:hypothetical protein [Acetobacteraceae bacterium]